MDDQHILPFVETIHGADFDAIGIFAGVAIVGNDVGHTVLSQINPGEVACRERSFKRAMLGKAGIATIFPARAACSLDPGFWRTIFLRWG